MSFPLEELSSRAIVIRKQIVRSAISELKAMEPSGLAGDDACLKSVWEEICAQVQGEESPEWDVYIQTIETIIAAAAEVIQPEEKCALWLYTDAGDRWLDDNLPTGISQIESLVFNIEDIANELTSHVLSAASDYETPSLYRFLHGEDDDSEEYDEDEFLEDDEE